MFGRILLCFLCMPLLFGSGCARSYDGTVIIPKPLDARRFWDKGPPRMQQSEIETSVFPVAPEAPGRMTARRGTVHASPRRQMTRISSSPPVSSEPANPLTCRNVSEPGKRYRMVCD